MIEEIVRAKEAYMLALDTLNLTKREYLNSINSYNDTIKEYDKSVLCNTDNPPVILLITE